MEGRCIFVAASDEGRRLYERLGFRVLEEKMVDLREIGAEYVKRVTVLLRSPVLERLKNV